MWLDSPSFVSNGDSQYGHISFAVLMSLIYTMALGLMIQMGVPLIAVCAVDTVVIWIFSKKDVIPGNHSKHSRMRAHDYLSYHVLVHD